MQKNSNKAITLVALVIIVIVMLILAGVGISLTIGENGIFKKTSQSKEIYEEQVAKEKLEMAMGDLALSKHKEKEYNEREYIDKALEKQGIMVIDNIAIVDNWLFEIDRSVPKVGNGLGRGKENNNIQISTTIPTISSDYVKANFQIQIEYEGEISEIIVKGEKIEIPTTQNGVWIVNQEVTDNGNYTIIVKDEDGNYKIGKVEITELSDDMDIWNKNDLETFRDKVNEGRTFAGKNIRVMADIDLECSEQNKWIPIGDYGSDTKLVFKGKFDGQKHTINGLYINATKDYQGLFGKIIEAEVANVILNQVQINATNNIWVAAIVGQCEASTIKRCGVSGQIKGYGAVARNNRRNNK